MRQKLMLLLFIPALHFSCNQSNACYIIFDNIEPSSIQFNILDKQTNNNLLFGDNKTINWWDLKIHGIDEDGEVNELRFDGVAHYADSVLLISVIYSDGWSSLSQLSAQKEIVIDYNGLYPSDTLEMEYAAESCGDYPVRHNYNVRLRDEYLCYLCFRDVFSIYK